MTIDLFANRGDRGLDLLAFGRPIVITKSAVGTGTLSQCPLLEGGTIPFNLR